MNFWEKPRSMWSDMYNLDYRIYPSYPFSDVARGNRAIVAEIPSGKYTIDPSRMNIDEVKRAADELGKRIHTEMLNALLTGDATRGNLNALTKPKGATNNMPEQTQTIEARFESVTDMIEAVKAKNHPLTNFFDMLKRDNTDLRAAVSMGKLVNRRMFLSAVGDAVMFPPSMSGNGRNYKVTFKQGKMIVECGVTDAPSDGFNLIAEIEFSVITERPTVRLYGITVKQDVWNVVTPTR